MPCNFFDFFKQAAHIIPYKREGAKCSMFIISLL